MSESKNFFKNTVMTLSRQISGILIGLLATVIIARILGPKGNGIYQLVVLLPTMLMTLLNFGVGSSSVYFVGRKKFPIGDILKTNTVSGLFLSLLSVILGFLSVFFFSNRFFSGVPLSYLYSILLIMPVLLLNEFYLVLFQGVQDFRSYNSLALVRQIIALLFLVIFTFILHFDLSGAVYSFILGVIGQFLLTLYFLKNRFQLSFSTGQYSKVYFKESFQYGYKAHFSNILSFINYRADMFVISMFLTPAAVGIYSVAVSIAERLWIVSQAISSVLFPAVSSIDDDESKNHLTSVISRNVLFFSILGGIAFYILCNLVITLLFGHKYDESAMVLKVLLPGIILFSVDRILSNDLAGRGKPEINMYTSILTVVSNLVMNIILVPKFGLTGAAFSTSFTYSMSTLVKVFLFKKNTGVAFSKILLIQRDDIELYKQLLGNIKRKRVKQ